jgi:hypothetical protein
MEQGKPVDQDGAEDVAAGRDQAIRRDLTRQAEDVLELCVEVLVGQGAQPVKEAADLDAVVSEGVGAAFG